MFHLLKTPFLAAPAEGFLALPFPLESSAFRLLAPEVGDGRTFERSDNCKLDQTCNTNHVIRMSRSFDVFFPFTFRHFLEHVNIQTFGITLKKESRRP